MPPPSVLIRGGVTVVSERPGLGFGSHISPANERVTDGALEPATFSLEPQSADTCFQVLPEVAESA